MNKLQTFLRNPRSLVLIAPFLLLAPVWLAGKALYWGTPSTQFIPWWWQAWQTLQAGELPLWNPMLGMGAPLLANYQSGLIYPPNWLYFLLAALGGLPWMAWGMAILVAVHLAWAGWGMAQLLKWLGMSELAQTIAGLAFALSGYLVARAHFLSIASTIAWLPWILLAAYEVAHQPKSRRAILKLALFFALQWLAGHAQISWYTLLLTISWVIFWSVKAGGWSRIARAGSRFTISAAFAFLLSAIQLLPTLEYLTQSQRGLQIDPQSAYTYSFWPWRLITLLAPNFFGNPAYGNYWGFGNYWEDAIYVGLIPLLLVISALVAYRKNGANRKLTGFLIVLLLISFLLALGSHTPIFPWLFEHVPTFALFQAPTRFSIWAVFALCLLAAVAAEGWRRPVGRGLYWSRLGVAAAAAVLLGAGLVAFANSNGTLDVNPTFVTASATAAVFAIGAAWLNLRAPAKDQGSSPRWGWLVSLLLMVDLVYAGWGLNPAVDLDFYREDVNLHAALRNELREGRLFLPPADEGALKFHYLFRFDDFYSEDPRTIRASLLPNATILDDIPFANNFDPLLPSRYQDWMETLAQASPEIQSQMLARMNVTLVGHIIPNEGASVSFEQAEAFPRARWVDCAVTFADSGQSLAAISSGQYSPQQEVIVEGDIADNRICGTGGSGFAEIATKSANQVIVSVSAPGGGWLVLADTYYPGWRAYANGSELSIYPADGLFRAVHLEPGEYEVEFIYRPLSFSSGIVTSLIAWPILLFLFARWKNEEA